MQCEPGLITDVKRAIDRDRRPGRFLLTGSANLLETSYQLIRLPGYAVNRTKRLSKSPRLFWSDTGLALHLGSTGPTGAHLENLVMHDLIAWRDARIERVALACWRTTVGEEVDFVIEAGGRLLLHTGPTTEWLAPDVLAVPWWRVL